jgi:hypothetical protein
MPHDMLCCVVSLQIRLQTKSAMRQPLTGRGGILAMASFMPREWSSSANGALRIAIIIIAGLLIWEFADGFLLAEHAG